MIAAHDAAARAGVEHLVREVSEGARNHDLLDFLNGITAAGTLPDEVAGRLVDVCGNDIGSIVGALLFARAEFDRFIQSTACRAAIQIKKGA